MHLVSFKHSMILVDAKMDGVIQDGVEIIIIIIIVREV